MPGGGLGVPGSGMGSPAPWLNLTSLPDSTRRRSQPETCLGGTEDQSRTGGCCHAPRGPCTGRSCLSAEVGQGAGPHFRPWSRDESRQGRRQRTRTVEEGWRKDTPLHSYPSPIKAEQWHLRPVSVSVGERASPFARCLNAPIQVPGCPRGCTCSWCGGRRPHGRGTPESPWWADPWGLGRA